MDGNAQRDNISMTGISSELTEIVDPSYKTFVPKIRIRLRPNSSEIHCQSNMYDALKENQDSGNAATKSIKNHINESSETKCYKILEDSGGGGIKVDDVETIKEEKHSYMRHGINLRARIPKPLITPRKLKPNELASEEDKRKIQYQRDKEFMNKPSMKSLCTKNSYKSFILNSSKNHRRKDKNNRKSVSKVRNEILGNINLKDIVNHENFLKLSSETQWQLVNLLPNCDKPKSLDSHSNCHCSDVFSATNEHHKTNPTVTYNAFNNEFLAKALTKYSMKMGQCDLINLLISERENLRSRPLTILTEDIPTFQPKDAEIKIEESNNNHNECDDIKPPDDIKSNSSVCTTETMEMNGTGNLFENISLKIEQCPNIDPKCVQTCDINNFISECNKDQCDNINEECSINDKDSVLDSQCDQINVMETNIELTERPNSPINHADLSPVIINEVDKDYKNLSKHLSIDTDNIYNELDKSDIFDDSKRKRGRKRKGINIMDDTLIIPVKRSNRSTAGKRPARLDSESPPISPNHTPNSDKKFHHGKVKNQKDRNRNNRKNRTRQGHSSDELDNYQKNDEKSIKPLARQDFLKYSKNCSSSPESLPNESDFSPLSKPSPNGSSIIGSFCRSSLVSLCSDKKTSNHINSVQALSPSWSCTSESTTPSVKSDYGHSQPTKTSPTLNSTSSGQIDMKSSIDLDTALIQGMPPPRQTLTLAAMREKMRAKKLAKEDNRKDSTSIYKKSSSYNNQKNKRQNHDMSSLLKEGDDDFQLMDKMMSSSEEFDELLNNSQDSLLEFFMSDDNYDFEATSDQCSNINSSCQKQNSSKSPTSKIISFPEESFNCKVSASNDCKTNSKDTENGSDMNNSHHPNLLINKSISNPQSNESTQSDKSIADTIANVLQKLNASKENGLIINSSATKTSVPNAYLVDGNGLSTALSIIQSLNPGAKVTTQQFYLVNSGPQLILQPSPPANIVSEKLTSSLNIQNKVSLAPKVSNQPSIVRQQSLLSSSLSSNSDGFSTMSLNQLSFTPNINEKSLNMTSESLNLLRNAYIKMPISESKNTYMMSPIAHNVPVNQSNALHLQTISTPHQIGLVHSVQPPLPSLFSSQLRFVHPSLASHQGAPSTISLIGPNIPANNSPITNANQSPKLLFLCPTVPNASGLSTSPGVLNQDQKYLLLSKQPDKQATIQLVSSQGLWQQLNPTMISQSNSLLVMQPQPPPMNAFDPLLCSNSNHHSNTITISHSDSQQANQSSVTTTFATATIDHNNHQQNQRQPFIDCSASSLIIDSRSLNSKLSQVTSNEETLATGPILKPSTSSSSCLSNLYSVVESKSVHSISSMKQVDDSVSTKKADIVLGQSSLDATQT